MEHAGQDIAIKDAIVFLFAAGLIVPALRMLKLPSVAGFILAGLALGPSGIGALQSEWGVLEYLTISEPAAAAPFAELGVLFLLFLLGLELSFDKLWALRRIVFGAGSLQVLASASVIALAASALGVPPAGAVLIGLGLALSSTAVVMQLLSERHQVASAVGRSTLGVLLLQDILVAPILIYAGFAGANPEAPIAEVAAEGLVQGVVAIGVIFIVGRFLLRRLFHMAAQGGGRDFLMALTLLTVVGAAAITASAGLSIALGAFLAGILLGETEFKHQAEIDLEPFKGVLLGLFFMTVGMSLDLSVVLAQWQVVIAGVAVLVVVKALIATAAIRAFVPGMGVPLEAAMLLAPAGEFAFVVLAAGSGSGVLSGEVVTLTSAIVGLSMLLTPLCWRGGRWLAAKVDPERADPELELGQQSKEGHVIIAGFGRVGRTIARMLEKESCDLVALDVRPDTVARARADGWNVYLGDGGRAEVLEKARVRSAMLVVVTVDDPLSGEAMVRGTRELQPSVMILARAQDADHAHTLYEAGANFVVPDAIEAALQMSARALHEFGYDTETVRDMIASERGDEYRRAGA